MTRFVSFNILYVNLNVVDGQLWFFGRNLMSHDDIHVLINTYHTWWSRKPPRHLSRFYGILWPKLCVSTIRSLAGSSSITRVLEKNCTLTAAIPVSIGIVENCIGLDFSFHNFRVILKCTQNYGDQGQTTRSTEVYWQSKRFPPWIMLVEMLWATWALQL